MIDYYKLEGRRIFSQSKVEKIKRWYIKREHKIIALSLGILMAKELAQWVYCTLKNLYP